MTRPAQPGETGIIVCDDIAEGQNIGKQVFVERQCCIPDQHRIRAEEPLVCYWYPEGEFTRCAPGENFCVRKTSVVVKEDPDPTPTVEELEQRIDALQREKAKT